MQTELRQDELHDQCAYILKPSQLDQKLLVL